MTARPSDPPANEAAAAANAAPAAADVEALAAALRAGDAAALDRLLAHAPALAAARTANGVPYTLVAIFSGRRALAERLARDRDDLDIVEAAALNRLERARAIVATTPAVVRRAGADGFTALHYAAHLGHLELAALLVDAGAEIDAVAANAIGATPLQSAVAGRQLETARLLVARGANVDATYEAGRTALHVAAASGERAIAELLVAHGARVDRRDDGGKTPAELAHTAGFDDLAARLR